MEGKYQLRYFFIISGLVFFAFSLWSKCLFCSSTDLERTRFSNQAILCLIFACIHVITGCFCLKLEFDYSSYKPLAAFVAWNVWILGWVGIQLSYVLDNYKVPYEAVFSILLAVVYVFLVILQFKQYVYMYMYPRKEKTR